MLFKCFPTPENADGAADRTAPPELVIRNMFGSKQPAGRRSAACSVATLRLCWLHPLLQLTRNYIHIVLERLVSQEVDIWALDVVRCGGTAGFLVFCDLS